MVRKQSDKSDKKKNDFFGAHLEVKPSFLQRPKTMEEVMAEAFSSTVAQTAPVVEPPAVAPTPIPAINPLTINGGQDSSTVAPAPTVVESAAVAEESPARLREEVARLAQISSEWQPLPALGESPGYWRGYALTWHWLEDEILPHLDKDVKLALRRFYRKAFGEPAAGGRFFGGQTGLAQEVGLSKRRIQDILELFHLLGWMRKIAHFNRGNRKGTDYELRLPPPAIEIFVKEANTP